MSASTSSSTPVKKVVIVGSGIFGVSTGLWMLKKGGYEVTILDKSSVLPAPDAASTDLNKIVRTGDYADPVIAALNIDATNLWRDPEWEGTYHESKVICVAKNYSEDGIAYVESSCKNVLDLGIKATRLNTSEDLRALYADHLKPSTGLAGLVEKTKSLVLGGGEDVPKLAEFPDVTGYVNPSSGWAEAARALEVGIKNFEAKGGVVRAGCEVVGLVEEEGEEDGKVVVKAVKLANGETVEADIVVVAAGAWTPALFAQEGMGGVDSLVATGQCVAKIQLTPEEAEEYSQIPVIFFLGTGFYLFPPNPQNIMKLAIHGAGYLNSSNPENPESTNEKVSQASGVSTPRTALTPGASDGFIPKKMVTALRDGLREVFPKLAAEKEFLGTRLCWYCDAPNGDWLIDWHPVKRNVCVATGGSGHAFKFFPNIGREILNRIEGTLSSDLAERWKYERSEVKLASKAADVRDGNQAKWLKVDELATKEDMAVPVSA